MRRTAAAVACVAALVSTTLAGPSTAADKLPVTYNFLVGAVSAGYPFNADPPGANIWSCKPSKRHPRPVVLLHGTAGNKNTNWRTYAPLLKNNGYCVYSFTMESQQVRRSWPTSSAASRTSRPARRPSPPSS